MDCRMIQEDLVAYTFGTAGHEERERIDAHLLVCTECLRAYLRVKHHVQLGASLDARPSDAMRRRIHDDVAAIVRPRPAARGGRWLRRPIPLYQGLAVAAVAAGIALAGPHLFDTPSHRAPVVEARVDTSREVARSLTIF